MLNFKQKPEQMCDLITDVKMFYVMLIDDVFSNLKILLFLVISQLVYNFVHAVNGGQNILNEIKTTIYHIVK